VTHYARTTAHGCPSCQCAGLPDAVTVLADLRAAGMRRDALARYVGVGTSSVTEWTAGRTHPTPYALRRLRELHSHLTGWERPPPVDSATA
jgi:transcriptional regulator with XRE-family HTH domain